MEHWTKNGLNNVSLGVFIEKQGSSPNFAPNFTPNILMISGGNRS